MSLTLVQNTFSLTIASVGQKVIAFVYFLFLARVMMPQQTGIYFLAVSVAMICSVVSDFGMTPVAIREIAKKPERTKTIIRQLLAIKIPLLCLGYVSSVLLSFVLGLQTEVRSLVFLTGLVLVLDSLHLLFYGVLRGQHRLRLESMGMFVGQILTATVGGFVLLFFPSLQLLALALLCGTLFNVFLSGTNLFRQFGATVFLPIWHWSSMKPFLRAALPFALAAIFVKVYSYVDSVLISKFLDTAAVGLYSLAYKFTYAFQFLPLAFIAALYPRFSALVEKDPDGLKKLFDRALWYMLILATPIVFGLSLLADQVVLLAGDGYRAAAPVLAMLVFVLLPIFLDFPIGSLLNASGRQSTKTAIMGLTMIVNVILNIFLIPQIGIMGSAYAALVSFTMMFFLGLVCVPKIIHGYRFHLLLVRLLQAGFCGILLFASGWLLRPFVQWILLIPLCGFVYLLALFLTGLVKREDVLMIKSVFDKRL